MQTMTEKKLRKQLEADLGVNLLPRKDFIRAVVGTSPLCILMNGMHTSCSNVITRDLQSSSGAPGLQDMITLTDPATDSPQTCTADGQRDTHAKPWAVLQVTEVVTYVSRKAVHPDTPLPKIAQQGGRQGPKPPKGRVIVIGAGPAGLAAASHLQVCIA